MTLGAGFDGIDLIGAVTAGSSKRWFAEAIARPEQPLSVTSSADMSFRGASDVPIKV